MTAREGGRSEAGRVRREEIWSYIHTEEETERMWREGGRDRKREGTLKDREG